MLLPPTHRVRLLSRNHAVALVFGLRVGIVDGVCSICVLNSISGIDALGFVRSLVVPFSVASHGKPRQHSLSLASISECSICVGLRPAKKDIIIDFTLVSDRHAMTQVSQN